MLRKRLLLQTLDFFDTSWNSALPEGKGAKCMCSSCSFLLQKPSAWHCGSSAATSAPEAVSTLDVNPPSGELLLRWPPTEGMALKRLRWLGHLRVILLNFWLLMIFFVCGAMGKKLRVVMLWFCVGYEENGSGSGTDRKFFVGIQLMRTVVGWKRWENRERYVPRKHTKNRLCTNYIIQCCFETKVELQSLHTCSHVTSHV